MIIWCIILIIIVLWYTYQTPAYFTVNPESMYRQIIENANLFDGQNYLLLKQKLPWIDPSIYADVKKLRIKRIPLTPDSLKVIL